MKKVLLIILVLIVAISYFNGQAEEILIPENAIRFRSDEQYRLITQRHDVEKEND